MIASTLRQFAYRLLGLSDRLDGKHSVYLSGATVTGRLELSSDAKAMITDCKFQGSPEIRIASSTFGYDPEAVASKINRTIRDLGIASL